MSDGEQIFTYPGPTDAQLLLLAKFIHAYNFIELNMRRAVETFALANMLKTVPKKGYRYIQASDLHTAIREVVEQIPIAKENVSNTLQGLEQIEILKPHRNMFAHFGVRQIPGAPSPALVFVNKDTKDFMAANGMEIPELGILFAITEVTVIEGLTTRLSECQEWFAHKTAEWADRYPKVAP